MSFNPGGSGRDKRSRGQGVSFPSWDDPDPHKTQDNNPFRSPNVPTGSTSYQPPNVQSGALPQEHPSSQQIPPKVIGPPDPNRGNFTFASIIEDVMNKCRGSRKLVLLIVAVALLLDNMLLTSVVPIIPAFLYELHHQKDIVILNETLRTSTPSPYVYYRDRYQEEISENSPLILESELMPTSRGGGDILDSYDEMLRECSCIDKLNIPLDQMIAQYQSSLSRSTGRGEARRIRPTYPPTTTSSTTMVPEMKLRHEELVSENLEVGVMFASKPVIQAIVNPFIGLLTNKIGYSIPMFTGFVIMFLSTLIFAIGTNYATLFIARALQGVGSSCTSVAGMGMLADRYQDDRERGNAMAIALGGLALGVLIGPPFGGAMYEFVGKSAPFIILALLALLDGLLQLLVLQPSFVKEEQEGASLETLIKDPYILVAAGAITFANMGIAILEPALPLWMMDTMSSSNWEQGAAFLPASISYLIGTNIFGPLGHRMGRWLASMIGLIMIGFALLAIPMATSLNDLIIPNGAIGFAIGMVDSSMMPMLGYLVDIRHSSVYGSVYAIGDVAFCAGFAVGPVLSGTLVKWFGFEGLVTVTAFLCFLFAPCMIMLRKPPITNDNQGMIVQDAAVRYVNYTTDDEEHASGPPEVINGGPVKKKLQKRISSSAIDHPENWVP